MEKKQTYLVIDAGNTRIKVAYFEENNLVQSANFESENRNEFFDYIHSNSHDFAILSSVLSEEITKEIYNRLLNCKLLSQLKIPLLNKYKTPKTLGADRLANAVASSVKAQGNRLSIDMGTCIKFDFVDSENCYLGGSISPGIDLRYKALHDHTGKLPLLKKSKEKLLIGNSTQTSIHSGIINGIQGEISHLINLYASKYEDLTIFVTGGDSFYFDYSLKNGIFADENLTLFGLLQILKANV